MRFCAAVPVPPITIAHVDASVAKVDPYVPSTGVAEGKNLSFETSTATS